MRLKYKNEIAEEIERKGFLITDFAIQPNQTSLTFLSRYGSLYFTFIQKEDENDQYKYVLTKYSLATEPKKAKYYASFEMVLNAFSDWLEKDVNAFKEDQDLNDPFEEFTGNKSSFFTDNKSKDDDSKLTAEESKAFKSELQKFQLYIESKYNLQQDQINEIKKSIDVLVNASKTETKGELKKGFRKFLIDFIQKVAIQGLIEGGKVLFSILQESPIEISKFTDTTHLLA